MKKVILSILSTLIITTSYAAAAPSVSGPTGTINNPSADTLREGQFSLGYYHSEEGSTGNHGVFNIGLSNHLEMGIAGYKYDGQSSETYANLKWNVASESVLTPGFAIGMEDIGAHKERSAYAVVSKALPLGFRVHAGVGDGRFDGFFGAIEKTINPLGLVTGNNAFPATTLMAEYDGKHMNYGARMAIVPGMKLDAGWRDKNFYAGLSMTM